MAKKSANKQRMTMIQNEAKKLWASRKYKKYSDAVAAACKVLKKQDKM